MKFLVIQTAFIGDAILASSVLEKLHEYYPQSDIDFFVRQGNQSLFKDHPFINKLYVWNKKSNKYKSLLSILKQVRKQKYDYVINLQRFATTGLFTSLSKGKKTIGFRKNPFSFTFHEKYEHEIGNGKHEIERNHQLIKNITDSNIAKLKLYPNKDDYEKVRKLKTDDYISISPASVWFTKQYPIDKWVEYIHSLDKSLKIYLLGGPSDRSLCEDIKRKCDAWNISVLAGELSFLQSAALMKDAKMNFTNDSAPLHIASAMNAPITSVFCSTVPEFGFTPLSDISKIVEVSSDLKCRPCGLHGKKECPLGHFNCAYMIDVKQL